MRSVFVARCVVLNAFAFTACSNDSSSSPTTPTSNTATITIGANDGSQSFSPNPAQVGGQVAVWHNSHGETHRIVANDGSFDTGEIAPGATSAMAQLPADGMNYHCAIHPTMIGAIGGSGGSPPPECIGIYC